MPNNATTVVKPSQVQGIMNEQKILEIEKSKVTNSRGEVPLMKENLFIADKNNSNIDIPIEINFEEEITHYREFKFIEAATALAGSLSLLGQIAAALKPMIALSFMIKMS